MLLATAYLAGCDRGHRSPAPAASGSPAVAASEAPSLDIYPPARAKADRAEAAYRAVLTSACASSDRRESLRAIGLIGDSAVVCADLAQAGRALAAGSFVTAGADEVLVQAPSGLAWAEAEQTLALLRHDGTSYHLVEHLFTGKGWQAPARVVTPPGRDTLLLCETTGHTGPPPATCGFLGAGSFRRSPPGLRSQPAPATEFGTLLVSACGPSSSVSIGAFSLEGGLLHVVLLLTDVRLDHAPGDKDDSCTLRAVDRHRQFDLVHDVRDGHAERLTPLPEPVREALTRR